MSAKTTLPCILVGLLLATPALADDVPAGTAGTGAATKGKSDIVTDTKVETAAKKDPKDKDATEWSVQGGLLATSGNTQSLAVTGGTAFRLRKKDDQLSAAAAVNYARASTPAKGDKPATPADTTVENYQAKVRYDRFISGSFVGFLGVQGRRDRFAGLDLRLQVDPGVGYYFIDTKPIVFWAELGYDFMHDIRRDDALVPQKDGTIPEKTATVHSGRAFLGYKNKINAGTAISFALEYLQGLSNTDAYRFNGEMIVSAKLTKTFSLATSFAFRYDHAALPGKEKLYTVTAASLVYSIF